MNTRPAPTLDDDLSWAFGRPPAPQPPPPTAPPKPPPPTPLPVGAAAPTGACVVCAEPVEAGHDRLVRPCGHAAHLACYVPLLAAGRTACAACGPPPVTEMAALMRGGYAVDAGGDAEWRARLAAAIDTVRCAGAPTHTHLRQRTRRAIAEPAHAAMISGALDPYRAGAAAGVLPPRLTTGTPDSPSIPRAAGGAAAADALPDGVAAVVVCSDAQCGGPTYCLHRVGLAAAASAAEAREDEVRSVVHAHYHYALPGTPYDALAAPAAAAVLAALFRARASVRDLVRCGATAEQLALCGLTLDSLTRVYALRDLVDALRIDWPRAQILGFHVALMRDRVRFPLHDGLLRAPLSLSAARLLAHAPLLGYAELRRELSLAELAALGAGALPRARAV